MKDLMRLTEIIKRKIENHYSDDIAIFAYYGSYATGLQEENSDIDFYFIPKSEKGKEMSIQFVVDGIGIDLFPITWERIARIATLDQPLTAVITKSKVLYSASPEDEKKFLYLQDKLEELFSPTEFELMTSKCMDYLVEAYTNLFNMKFASDNLDEVKIESSKLISNILLALAFINNTYYKRSIGRAVQEALNFEKLPQDFKVLVDRIISEKEIIHIVNDCEKLIFNVRSLLLSELSAVSDKEPYETLFIGYYEELKSSINKVIRACNNNDYYTAFFRSALIQEETSRFLSKAEQGIWYSKRNAYSTYKKSYDEILGINLLDSMDNLSQLKDLVIDLDIKLRDTLIKRDVELLEFESIEDFDQFYNGK